MKQKMVLTRENRSSQISSPQTGNIVAITTLRRRLTTSTVIP